MGRVEQRRVLGLRRLNVGPRRLRATQLEGDSDDLEAFRMKLAAQRLPPGQIEGAASIGGPRNQRDLLAPQRRQVELIAFEVIEDKLGGLGAHQATLTE